jgi:hypothetical protein
MINLVVMPWWGASDAYQTRYGIWRFFAGCILPWSLFSELVYLVDHLPTAWAHHPFLKMEQAHRVIPLNGGLAAGGILEKFI